MWPILPVPKPITAVRPKAWWEVARTGRATAEGLVGDGLVVDSDRRWGAGPARPPDCWGAGPRPLGLAGYFGNRCVSQLRTRSRADGSMVVSIVAYSSSPPLTDGCMR
jgi:hypothetical protein